MFHFHLKINKLVKKATLLDKSLGTHSTLLKISEIHPYVRTYVTETHCFPPLLLSFAMPSQCSELVALLDFFAGGVGGFKDSTHFPHSIH